jgi:hypothetical protein
MKNKRSITDDMIAKARLLWPDAIDFDVVQCTNADCGFMGLVQLGQERCPDCEQEELRWADANLKEFSL